MINCTTVGWNDQINESPINSKELSLLTKDAFVYDVIYQPIKTKLLNLAAQQNLKLKMENELRTSNFAFKYVMPELIKSEKKISDSLEP